MHFPAISTQALHFATKRRRSSNIIATTFSETSILTIDIVETKFQGGKMLVFQTSVNVVHSIIIMESPTENKSLLKQNQTFCPNVNNATDLN